MYIIKSKNIIRKQSNNYAPELCEDCSNEFYEITNTNLGFHANEYISIGGVEVKVRKIMAIKGQWIENNFVKPLEDIKYYEKQKEIEQNQRFYTPRVKPSEKEKNNSC